MGIFLSWPYRLKKCAIGEDDRLAYGLSAMQGWRTEMEDTSTALLNVRNSSEPNNTGTEAGTEAGTEPGTQADTQDRLSFFGVYDGHGGDKVAIFCRENLHKILLEQPTFGEPNYPRALKDAFLATDRAIYQDPAFADDTSGSTACTALISDNRIYVANAGDCRAVLGVRGRARPLSFDHKPNALAPSPDEGEMSRVIASGGSVSDGRINNGLNLSRALGDFAYKQRTDLPPEQQTVTAFPDVRVHNITCDDEFLVLASDGIWECHSSQWIVQLVRRGIVARLGLRRICEVIHDMTIAPPQGRYAVGYDNMTMIIVALLQGRTREEWYDMVAARVVNRDGPCARHDALRVFTPLCHHDDEPALSSGPFQMGVNGTY